MIVGIQCIDANGFYAEKDNPHLPWLPGAGDLDWFQFMTKGQIVVVGRNTFKTLPPLKNREVWPVGKEYELKTVKDVLKKYKTDGDDRDLFIGGGAALWQGFSEHYDNFYQTVLNQGYISKDNGLKWDWDKPQTFSTVIRKKNYTIFRAEKLL